MSDNFFPARVVKHLEMYHGKSWRKEVDSDVKVYGLKFIVEPQKGSPQPGKCPNAGKKGPVDGVLQQNKEQSGTSIKEKFLEIKESRNSFQIIKKVCMGID